jgi:hypothetical protein
LGVTVAANPAMAPFPAAARVGASCKRD